MQLLEMMIIGQQENLRKENLETNCTSAPRGWMEKYLPRTYLRIRTFELLTQVGSKYKHKNKKNEQNHQRNPEDRPAKLVCLPFLLKE